MFNRLSNSLKQWSPQALNRLDWGITTASVTFCALAMPLRLPAMELTGLGPNWLLIWVVSWSVKRNLLQGVLAGIFLGWIQDGLTQGNPTHAISLAVVGLLTARLQKQKFIIEDFISVALIVFGMVIMAEAIFALQMSWQGERLLPTIWMNFRQAALGSAILSSLWAPAIYYPLNRWWQWLQDLEAS